MSCSDNGTLRKWELSALPAEDLTSRVRASVVLSLPLVRPCDSVVACALSRSLTHAQTNAPVCNIDVLERSSGVVRNDGSSLCDRQR